MYRVKFPLFCLLALVWACELTVLSAQAATVATVDDANVGVDSAGEKFNLNDLYFTVSADGAKHSVIKITEINQNNVTH